MNPNPNPEKPSLILAGIFLVSLSLLMFEIILTKTFSIMLFYHFAFLAVCIALVGIGVSSLLVYLLPNVFSRQRFPLQIIFFSSLLAVSIPLVMYLLLNYNLPGAPYRTNIKAIDILPISFIAMIPFLLSGFVIALIFFHRSKSFSKFYFANLAGSGIGCGLLFFCWIPLGA